MHATSQYPKTLELTLCTFDHIGAIHDDNKVKATFNLHEEWQPARWTKEGPRSEAAADHTDKEQAGNADTATTAAKAGVGGESQVRDQDARLEDLEGLGQLLRALGVGNAANVCYIKHVSSGDE